MSTPFTQPAFDSRITTLVFPLSGGQYGQLQRGFMAWDMSQGNIGPYGSAAQVNFLYNPSSVTADYSITDASVAASIMFPSAFNAVDLRVPLNQTVEWSLLFDRTYELWGSYNAQAIPNGTVGANPNNTNPGNVGVLADIMAMQQFTGMFMAFSTGNTGSTTPAPTALTGWQGIMQLIPSWVYFGGSNSASNSLWYYGYVSEWDVTVTHWTQYMIPMRCVINITFTMLPPPNGANPIGTTGTTFTPGGTGTPGAAGVGGPLPAGIGSVTP